MLWLTRYIDVLQLGLKARDTQKLDDLAAVFEANIDVCLLRLIAAFLQSVPQLVFQMYIILGFSTFTWLQGTSPNSSETWVNLKKKTCFCNTCIVMIDHSNSKVWYDYCNTQRSSNWSCWMWHHIYLKLSNFTCLFRILVWYIEMSK